MVKVKDMRILQSPTGSLRAFCDVLFHDSVVVKGVRVIEGNNGLFVALPSEKSAKDEKWYPLVKIIDTPTYEEFQRVVLDYYESGGRQPLSETTSKQKAGGQTPEEDVPF